MWQRGLCRKRLHGGEVNNFDLSDFFKKSDSFFSALGEELEQKRQEARQN
jgi:hypothetical protein